MYDLMATATYIFMMSLLSMTFKTFEICTHFADNYAHTAIHKSTMFTQIVHSVGLKVNPHNIGVKVQLNLLLSSCIHKHVHCCTSCF